MFDKMKALMEAQKKLQEVKRQLEETTFEIASPEGGVRITMNGSQEVREIALSAQIKEWETERLAKILKDTYNKAIKRSQELAAQKMQAVAGSALPGLF